MKTNTEQFKWEMLNFCTVQNFRRSRLFIDVIRAQRTSRAGTPMSHATTRRLNAGKRGVGASGRRGGGGPGSPAAERGAVTARHSQGRAALAPRAPPTTVTSYCKFLYTLQNKH